MHKQQLHQRLKLKHVISQQTIQLMKLIELSNNSLELEILKEVEENVTKRQSHAPDAWLT